MSALDDSVAISRYLLHELTETEQEEIERRYFSDPEYLALLEAVEGDLIDAYVRRDLSQAQRLRFEQYFLCTRARRERLRMAEALQQHLPQHLAQQAVPFPAARVIIAIAASLLVLAGIAAWLWTRTAPPAVVDRPLPPPPRVETPRVPVTGAVTPVTVAVTLLPGLTRDAAAPPKILLGAGVEQVRASALVEVEGEWRDLRASLRPGEWSAANLTMNADRTVTITIPAAQLAPGEHVLVLTSGDEPLGDYVLVVENVVEKKF